MKTNSPNVLFNHRAIVLLEKTSQTMRQKLLLMLLLVSFCTGTFAQSARIASQQRAIVVTDMNTLLSANESTSARMASANSAIDVTHLRDLVTQVQSSSYFYDGEVKTYGDVPTNLFTDLSSLNRVDRAIALKNNIEIVTVLIKTASELNATIDLSAFSNFPNLKYIYFISSLNTTGDSIARNITNFNERFNILFKIDRGDRNQ